MPFGTAWPLYFELDLRIIRIARNSNSQYAAEQTELAVSSARFFIGFSSGRVTVARKGTRDRLVDGLRRHVKTPAEPLRFDLMDVQARA